MFCFQCEQTGHGTGCIDIGVCGKDPSTAALQDLLLHGLKSVAVHAHRARKFGAVSREIDVFVVEALFATLTNVNFDADRFDVIIDRCAQIRDQARDLYINACAAAGAAPEPLAEIANWTPSASPAGKIEEGETISILTRRERLDPDVASTQELLTYGLKGLAAYLDHALVLGAYDEEICGFIHEMLDYLTDDDAALGDLLGSCLKVGEVNLRVMELLDKTHTDRFGHPTPTAVRIHPVKGKAIVVSGHDIKDLEALLIQTEGKGINVYTHGELLPAHGYPKLKAYKHLIGNYGGAWQKQGFEFEKFPGAILMTTNCIQEPRAAYCHRIFTSGQVGWPGATHISDGNFAPVIEAALAEPGFETDGPDDTILVGFGHNAVLGVADKVIEAVKSGAIRHFFLIGGCDGARPGRDYYARTADLVPSDCMILTLACGKYRFNTKDFGTVAGLPRLLDIGQCNDAYSAIKIAVALSEAFGCGVNDLPLSLILSWYEQKAVAILLTLLHLGIKNIKLGPTLPAFVTPNVLNILVENYGLSAISTPIKDLTGILGPLQEATA
jgi:hydroxylamine reductase